MPNMSVPPPNVTPNVTNVRAQSVHVPGCASQPQHTTAAQSTVPRPSFDIVTQPMPQVGGAQAYPAPSQPRLPIRPGLGDADFYLSLLPPWNVLPEPGTADMFKESRKVPGFIIKFSGTTSYTAWRHMFISRVHLMEIPVWMKVQVMILSLDSSCLNLINIIDQLSVPDAYKGYRDSIRALEGLFGVKARDFEAAVARLKSLPSASDKTKAMNLLSAVQIVLSTAECEGLPEPTKATQGLLFEAIESKLPVEFKGVYRIYAGNKIRAGDFLLSHVEEFIKDQVAATPGSRVAPAQSSAQNKNQTQTQTTKKIKTAQVTIEKKDDITPDGMALSMAAPSSSANVTLNGCVICDVTSHSIEQCRVFKILLPHQCRAMVMARHMCSLCLEKGHMTTKCTHTQTCDKCKGRHHPLLHQNRDPNQGQNQNQNQNQGQQKAKTDVTSVSNAQNTAKKISQPAPANSTGKDKVASINLARYLGSSVVGDDNISLRTIPVFVCSEDGNETLVTVLLDDGAQCSVVTRELADRLGLEGTPIDARIEGIGGKISRYSTVTANLYVAPSFTIDVEDAQPLHKVEVIVMDDPIMRGPAVDWRKASRDVPYFHGLEFPKMKNPKIELLIGHSCQTLMRGQHEIWRPDGAEGPDAKLTVLGWTATGNVKYVPCKGRPYLGPGEYRSIALNAQTLKSNDVMSKRLEMHSIERLPQQMWQIDCEKEFKQTLSIESQYVIEKLRNTFKFLDHEGMYKIGCTWQPDQPDLPDNRSMALHRLERLE